MLSHFMGGHNRQSAKELWLAEREVGQLADKLASHRRRAREDLAERDRRIAAREQELQQTRNQLANSYRQHAQRDVRTSASWQSRLERGQRRLSAARARLRAVEQKNQRLAALVDTLADIATPSPFGRAPRETGEPAAGRPIGPLHPLCRWPLPSAAPPARPRRGTRDRAAVSRRRPGRGPAGAGEPGRPGRRGVLPDRLHQPSRLSQGQASLPPAGQAVRAAAQQQRHLLCPRDRRLARRARRSLRPG